MLRKYRGNGKKCQSYHQSGMSLPSGSAVSVKIGDDSEQSDIPFDTDERQFVPRGRYFEHDDRFGSDDESARKVEDMRRRPRACDAGSKWKNDRFNPKLQAPKSDSELVKRYGYNIRKGDPPRSPTRLDRVVRGDGPAGLPRLKVSEFLPEPKTSNKLLPAVKPPDESDVMSDLEKCFAKLSTADEPSTPKPLGENAFPINPEERRNKVPSSAGVPAVNATPCAVKATPGAVTVSPGALKVTPATNTVLPQSTDPLVQQSHKYSRDKPRIKKLVSA